MSIPATDILSVILSINGRVSNAMIKKIEVYKGVNKISKATVILIDDSNALEDFQLSDSSDFNLGNKIEIKTGYHSKEKTIFKGVILSQTILINAQEGPSLCIECKDEAFKTIHGLKNNYFHDSTDSEIINKILGDYGLNKSIDNTSYKHEEVIQYGITDWDFILSRADLNGLVVITDDGNINVSKPNVSSNPVLALKCGENIIELNLTLDTQNQLESVDAVSWDASNQTIIQGKSIEPDINSQGNITGKDLAKVANINSLLQTVPPLKKEVLDVLANAQLLKSRLSRFQGTILCEGNADIKPNTLVEIKGIGKKFNGNAFVSSVCHELDEGRWFTEITIGLHTLDPSVNLLSNSESSPAISGLQVGVVKKTHDDPSGAFRVLVTLPIIKDSEDGIWARLGNVSASKGFGSFFYPEIGDEVILGFLDGNPSAPIILGSVYSKKNEPFTIPDEKNTHKSITTSSGITVDFNEEDKTIVFKTPDNNKITLSDKDKGITLTDQNDNNVQLSAIGIVLESKKDIIIKAANKISMVAKDIDIKAKGNLNLSANNITEKADVSYSSSAGASSEIKASGNVTVKGAMVSIN